MSEADLQKTKRSIAKHLLTGGVIALVLLGTVGGWLVAASIAGAVIAPGTVIVQSNTKRVQHLYGGLVAEIQVKDGDTVKAGDALLRLDPTQILAERAVLRNRSLGLRIRKIRLLAEHRGLESLTFPEELKREVAPHANVQSILRGQQYLFQTRREMRLGSKAQMNEQIRQLESRVRGLEAIKAARASERDVLRAELADLETLQRKQLVRASRLNELKRLIAETEGEHGRAVADIATAGGRTADLSSNYWSSTSATAMTR